MMDLMIVDLFEIVFGLFKNNVGMILCFYLGCILVAFFSAILDFIVS
jgi:hypothetical protein